MDWQTVISLWIVFGALIFVVRKFFRSAKGSASGCGTSCSSCSASLPEYSVKKIPLVKIGDE